MDLGSARWITARTADLLIPKPNAIVPTMIFTSSQAQASWFRCRVAASIWP